MRITRAAPWIAASLLAISAFLLVLGTNRMGFTRDESFYFRFAEVYQNWLHDRAQDADRAESRQALLRTWSQNFEHPPLVKLLMGWGWRAFARKERPAVPIGHAGAASPAQPLRLTVRELGPSQGFAEGARVELLGPQAVDQSPRDPARRLGAATVVQRSPTHAIVEVSVPDAPAVRAACARYAPGPRFMQGCTAVQPGPLGETQALRLVGPFFTAFLVFAMVLFGWTALHPVVGLLAPALFLLTPRWFFHAHVGAFDLPVTAMIFAIAAAFWVSLERPAWAWVTALLWGLGLLVKHNALFLPVPMVAFWLLAHRRALRLRMPRPGAPTLLTALAASLAAALLLRHTPVAALTLAAILALAALRARLHLPRIPLAFLVMPPIGFAILFLGWPRLWVDPYRALEAYLGFHLAHEHYLQQYFGRVMEVPPFPVAFPFVLTLLTVGALTLVATVLGAWDLVAPWLRARVAALRHRAVPMSAAEAHRARLALYLILLTLFPIALIALPSTPIFGGVKHWMTGMPFLCFLAAWGLWRLAVISATALGHRSLRAPLAALLGVLVLLPQGLATARTIAVGNAHYNELAGGLAGAADRKLTRVYWGYTASLALNTLNHRAKKNARVFLHDATYDAYWAYRREGRIRRDLRIAQNPETADLTVFEQQKFFAEMRLDILRFYGAPGPLWSWRLEGLPLVSIYGAPGALDLQADAPSSAPPPP